MAGIDWTVAAAGLRRGIRRAGVFGLLALATAPVLAQQTVNTARIAVPATIVDPVPANNSATDTNTVVRATNLSLAKSAPTTVQLGQTLTWSLTVSNAGTSAIVPADTLSIVESLPAGLTSCTYTPSAGTFTVGTIASGATGTGTWTGVSIASGANATLSIACTVTASAPATLTNNATVLPPAGNTDPDCSGSPVTCSGGNTASTSTTVQRPVLGITKTGPANAPAGGTISWTLTITNSGSVASGTGVVVLDQLPAGVVANSATGANCGALPSAPGALLSCTLPSAVAVGTPAVVTITATLPSAAGNLVNYASVSTSGTGTPGTPGPTCAAGSACASASVTVAPPAAQVAFCTANTLWSITQGTNTGAFYRYTFGQATDELVPELNVSAPSNLNGLMIDQDVNRLLFVSYSGGQATIRAYDANNGGWYIATPAQTTPDFPRAGMTRAGVGYLIEGGTGVTTPRWYTLTRNGTGFGYTLALGGTLSFDFPPTSSQLGSGDIAFDDAGNGWMAVGPELFKIDFTQPTVVARRQARPQLNGAASTVGWASVAWGGNNTLYFASNASDATGGYYSLNLATNVLTRVASTSIGQSRDLASCSFPAAPTPPVLQVEKTLGLVNDQPHVAGAPVHPGDKLTYRITVRHVGGQQGATVFANDVADTIPANTTVLAAGDGNTLTNCDATTCRNAAPVNLPVGGSHTFDFVVRVNATLPAGTAAIANTVAVRDIDCATAGNVCTTSDPVGAVLALEKTAPTTVAAGSSFDYTLTLRNSGATATGASVTVLDQLPAGVVATGVSGATCATVPSTAAALLTCTVPGPIAANGGTATFTITATAPSTDGPITNHASVNRNGNGTPTAPGANGCTSSVTLACADAPTTVQSPALTLVKTASATSFAVGTPASYTLTVTNNGTAATTAVASISDTLPTGLAPGAAPAGCTITGQVVACSIPAGLATGASAAFVIPVTAEASVAGTTVTNSATVSGGGDPACPAAARCTGTVDVTVTGTPALTLVKSATVADTNGNTVTGDAGDTITYAFSIENTGNVPLSPVTVSDPRLPSLSCSITTLAVGQTASCTATNNTYVIQPSDVPGDVVNTATARGTAPGTLPPAEGTSTVQTPTAATPVASLVLTKSASVADTNGSTVTGDAGDTITYTFSVENTGTVALAPVVVTDPLLPALSCQIATLAVGQTAGCAASGNTYVIQATDVPGGVTNTATAEGTAPGTIPPAIDSDTVVTPTSATPVARIALTKSATVADTNGNTVSGDAGDTITYAFSVENTGDLPLAPVVVTDPLLPSLSCSIANLAVGQTASCVATGNTYVIQAGDVPGGVENTATARGTAPGNVPAAEDTDTITTPTAATPVASLALSKTGTVADTNANGLVGDAGDTISYAFSIENTGTVTLAPVTVEDPRLPSLVCTLPTLAAGATEACVASNNTYVIQVGDLPGPVVNTATARGTAPGTLSSPSATDTETTPVIAAEPALSLVKTAGTPVDVNGNGVTDAGDTIAYSFVVTNTGNVPLNGVVINDAMLSATPIACTPSTVAVNGTANCGPVTYTVTAADVTAGSVDNSATATGTPPGGTAVTSEPSTTTTPTTAPAPSLSLVKTAGTPVDVNGNGITDAGDTIAYSFVVTNTGNVPLEGVVINDAMLSATPIACTPSTIAVNGTANCGPVTYTVTAADVTAGAVNNSATATGTPPGGTSVTSDPSTTTTPTTAPAPSLSLVKTAGTPVDVNGNGLTDAGDTIAYGFVVTNTGNVPLNGVVINDAMLSATPIACTPSTLALNGTANCGPVVYTVTAADVTAGSVDNSATASGTPPGGTPVTSAPSTTTTPTTAPAPSLSLVKTAGTPVDVNGNGITDAGDTIAYSFVVTNTGNVPLDGVVVNDAMLSPMPIACTPSTIALNGTANCGPVTYTVTAADVTAGAVNNSATATGTPPGGTPVTSAPSTTTTPTAAPAPALDSQKRVTANADQDGSGSVSVGDTLTYTIIATNTGNVPLRNVTISDARIVPTSVTCPTVAVGAVCELVGTYTVVLADADAGRIDNTAVVTSEPPPGSPPLPPEACPAGTAGARCNPAHTVPVLQAPAIATTKTAVLTTDGGTPGVGNIGDVITYTVTATNTGNVTLANITVLDSFQGGPATTLSCSPTTLQPGQVATCATYTHVVTVEDANGGAPLVNTVTASGQTIGGAQTVTVTANAAATIAIEPDPVDVRATKTATPRDVKVGDLVRYTVVLQNTGTTPVVDGTLVDTPPAGFTYVDGSLVVADRDGVGRLVGTSPIRVDQIDIAANDRATISYLLRVGAGVRAGLHVNSAVLQDDGQTVSNVATAEVQLVADPLLDESLILGTVWDDRDGDGWQDTAVLEGVSVRGGFAAAAYVAGSTTIDRGDGASPLADASAPLLRGVDIGRIAGRQSEAQTADAHAVVIAQTLRSVDFSDDFVLTTDNGVTLRMDAVGNVRTETSGAAAKGTTAALPTVTRRVSQVADGVRVEYVIGNAGIEERGIPGVRIATVEGLLVETDQFGRFHLVGVDGGRWERGRNFIMKVDAATLPPGSTFTTPNPLVRRITPGLPVRFDFGVKLPSGLVEGGTDTVEMEIGTVLFDADSAVLRESYAPAIDAMAEQVRTHGAGEVVIGADGDHEALAYDRAKAVQAALLSRLSPEDAAGLQVTLRADVDDPDSRVVSLGASPVLGTILFDTDRATIKPEYRAVIAKVAADINALGGGTVGVIGHADRRGSLQYNDALGLRRAKAVHDAIAAQLDPEVRSRLRVETSASPTAPVGIRGR